jgi:hypothetical protein
MRPCQAQPPCYCSKHGGKKPRRAKATGIVNTKTSLDIQSVGHESLQLEYTALDMHGDVHGPAIESNVCTLSKKRKHMHGEDMSMEE